jgi:hypothetical protein
MSPTIHLWTETDPVSRTLCSLEYLKLYEVQDFSINQSVMCHRHKPLDLNCKVDRY